MSLSKGRTAMTDTNTKEPKKPRRWTAILVPTVLTVAVTIAVALYTVNRSERQTVLAEAERARSVKSNLVSIIEEHVINQKPIDCIRLMRLIELKSHDERLATPITARQLIEQAEYNILNSRYLDFDQKENFKSVFDKLYMEMVSEEYSPFKDVPHTQLLNKLARSIQQGKSEESLSLLSQYVERSVSELAELQKKTQPSESFLRALLKSGNFWIFMGIYVVFVLVFYPYYVRVTRRMRERARE